MKKIFKKWYFLVGAFFVLIIIIASSGKSPKNEIVSSQQANNQSIDSRTETNVSEQAVSDVEVSNDTTSKKDIPISPAKPIQQSQTSAYKVVEVVDGDTIKVSMNGSTETLRIIGLNTPETVDPRKPVECFGKEASNKAKELLSGKTVKLEADSSQGERDKYGRLLRYVFMSDGTDYGKYMIASGYAYEYTYNTPYKYQTSYKSAQANAQTNKIGLWSSNTCNGSKTKTDSPTVSTKSGNYYTSSYSTSKYYYPVSCDGWKSLDEKYLKSFETLDALHDQYPSRTLSPNCQ